MRRKTWRVVLVAGLATTIGLTVALWPVQMLTLRDAISQELVYSVPVRSGQLFRLRFLHSYEKGWVMETYKIHPKGYFYLTEHAFQVFNYDDREATYPGDFSMDGGYARVKNIDRYQEVAFPSLYIRVANIVPQMLEVGSQTVSLPDLIPGGTLLFLRVENLRNYQVWFYRSRIFANHR